MAAAPSTTGDEARSIVITRVIDAPRELVFKAWTTAEHLAHWWGPDGFTTTTEAFSFKAKGEWRFVMHGPDGRDYPNRIIFESIQPPARIVYNHSGDADSVPVRFHATVTLEDESGKTRLTWNMVFESEAERDRIARDFDAVEGGRQTAARLDAYVAREFL